MNRRLPNEILSHILNLVGEESTLDLKPLVLVNRQWNSMAASNLLKVICVSSLGELVRLCNQIIEYHNPENSLRSSVAKYTKTLIVSGIIDGTADSHLGLDDLGDQPRGTGEESEDYAIPADIKMEPDMIRSKLHTALSRLVLLEGFEWYGRFAGDYYLVRYLQQTKIIRHLAYGIDMFVSSESLGKPLNMLYGQNGLRQFN
jgi:hypothetical protein